MSAPAAVTAAAPSSTSTGLSPSPLLDAELSDILGTTVAEIEASRQLLSSIRYADKHSHDYCEFLGFLGDVARGDIDAGEDSEESHAADSETADGPGDGILNYSQLWEATPADVRKAVGLPNLMELRNGDVIQTVEYRGIGRHYVLWLACPPQEKPIVWHSDKAVAAFIRYSKHAAQQHEKDIANFAFRKATDNDELGEVDDDSDEAPADFVSYEMPVLVAREADVPVRPDYHCYFFSNCQAQCDEYGYSPAYAMSNGSTHYFDAIGHDQAIRVIDPCLTHPLSQYGKVISEAKASKRYENDEHFPYQYVGYFDDSLEEPCEWTRLQREKQRREHEADDDTEEGEEQEEEEEVEEEEEENPHGYNLAHIRLTRLLFAQHFAYIRLRQKTVSEAQSQVLIKDLANITASYAATP